jgi:phenylacetate-coenzyme A ligase PaaK-like adenylate-forming protein
MSGVTNREAIAALYREAAEQCIQTPPHPAKNYLVRSTSGTTGAKPLHVLYELGYEGTNRFPDARKVMLCASPMHVRLSNVLSISSAPTVQQVLCFDPRMLEREDIAAHVIREFQPDTVFGMISFVSAVFTRIRTGLWDAIKRTVLTGEYLTEDTRALLKKCVPNARISQTYASTETAQVSKLQCVYLPPNAYHVLDGTDIEIHEPDEEGVGLVLVSKKVFRMIRLERYAIGDMGRLSSNTCACGEKQTLYMLGRSGYDHIKVAGALLRKEEFDRVAGLCPQYIDDYRAEAFIEHRPGQLLGGIELTVFRERGVLSERETAALAERFSSELFITPTRTLADLVRERIFMPLRISVVNKPFPLTLKVVKLKLRT